MSDFDNFLSFEEAFYDQDRKESRKERKRIQQKDRSKYKKTDQPKNELISTEGLLRGRVLAILPEEIVVDSDGKIFKCQLKGSLKQIRGREKNLVTIGDFVLFDDTGGIAHIEPRRSVLARVDNLSHRKQHVIAANVDQVFIVSSLLSPPLKPTLIDRYIIAAQLGNMKPIVVINKIDLLSALPEEQKELFRQFVHDYSRLDFPLILVSAQTGTGLDDLRKLMAHKTSVFSGQSGVGKSSLINAMLGTSLATGELVQKTGKGTHTTTFASLIPLHSGGFCVDTPGIRSFGLWDIEPDEIGEFFPEIFSVGRNCKFPDCRHTEEPECAVQKAVEDGIISPIRFASYLSLLSKETLKEWE